MRTTRNEKEAGRKARRDDVVDVLHGHRIADPYRWLEDSSSKATQVWTHQQHTRTHKLLGAIPGRDRIEAELTDLLQVGAVSDARQVQGRYFYMRRAGGQDQPALHVRSGIDGEAKVLIDPSEIGRDGLTSLDWWHVSPDGSHIAYGLSEGGDEWAVLHVIEVDSGRRMGEAIPHTRASSVAWLPDNGGFYYTRHPIPGTVSVEDESYFRRVYFHEMGSDHRHDALVMGETLRKEDLPLVMLDASGRWLAVTVREGWTRSWIHVLDRHRPEEGFRDITPGGVALHEVIGIDQGALYNLTTWQAPRYQVMRYRLEDGKGWEGVVAEREDRVIEHATLTRESVITGELENAIGKLRQYGRDGQLKTTMALPGIGMLVDVQGTPDSDVVVAVYESFVQPPSALVYQGALEPPRDLSPIPLPDGFEPGACEIRQLWYPSKDGEPISMFVVHRKGLELDGSHPVYLTGYGGFNVTRGSEYQPSLPFWLGRGGVYALPNVRGGAEYGSAWHEAGMLANKQNTFNDFIAAAEYLIAERYTSPERLSIAGGSNGGLLVGAAITQRPELFRAAISMVPLLDMLRYHLFRIGRLWIPEYGSPEDAEQFGWLHAYSPYHAVREGVAYPAVLLTLGENDSRVDPMHARKMAAALQHSTTSGKNRPILLRAQEHAGHGKGKPLWMRVQETADLWVFLCWQLGVDI